MKYTRYPLGEVQWDILQTLLEARTFLRTEVIADECGLTERQVRKKIQGLIDRGLVVKDTRKLAAKSGAKKAFYCVKVRRHPGIGRRISDAARGSARSEHGSW